jgi:hypothetical protein
MEADYTVAMAPKQYTPELGGTQQKSPIVRLFGVTEKGNSVMINGARATLRFKAIDVSRSFGC